MVFIQALVRGSHLTHSDAEATTAGKPLSPGTLDTRKMSAAERKAALAEFFGGRSDVAVKV